MNSYTIVSCYYKIKSKRSHDNYNYYINNLFSNINVDINMIIFTSSDTFEYLNNIVNKFNNIHIIIKDFDDLILYKKYDNIWNKQYEMDKQKNTGRSIECYILWNSKLLFINEAIEKNIFNSDKFIWMDIGMIRNNSYKQFLNNFPLYENISINKIDIILLKKFNNPTQKFFQDEIHFSGACYGGGIEVFKKFINLYYNKFDEYLYYNKFIGCDQQIISSVYLENMDLFNSIFIGQKNFTEKNKLIKPNYNIDIWFYLIYYYSN